MKIQRMDCGKHPRVFDANRREIVDVKETAIIDLGGGDAPNSSSGMAVPTRSRSNRSKLLELPREPLICTNDASKMRLAEGTAFQQRVDTRRFSDNLGFPLPFTDLLASSVSV